MAKSGDQFIVTLGKTHLGWGTHRYKESRTIIREEGYLPIPASVAKKIGLYNSNHSETGLGFNEFEFSTSDKFITNKKLKSSGASKGGDIYAKNFHGSGELKLLGSWFNHIGATEDDKIKIEFISPTELILSKI